jgi:uncharacterized protein
MGQNDFDYGFLSTTAHRPWALPNDRWIMTQSWHDVLFAHWPVDPAVLRSAVPSVFPLDVYEGRAWIGIVPFHMTNVAPRGVPALPWFSAFPELNVRTYVTSDGKPGVYFLSLDAANPLAVRGARRFFHLPYFSAAMQVESQEDWIAYESRRVDKRGVPAQFTGRYRAMGPAQLPVPGTLEHFLTERYCLYTISRRGDPYRLEIHHAPWPLQPAELELAANSMADASGIPLRGRAPLVHYARRQDVVAWPLRRMTGR